MGGGKLQDINISQADIHKLYDVRQKIKESATHLTETRSTYTFDCLLSHGVLQLSPNALSRGLIIIMDDNNELRWMIKIVIDMGFIRLSDPLALIGKPSAWLNQDSPEYKEILPYISDFIYECFTITEFNIYTRDDLSPQHPLIHYIGTDICLQ
jgi:hypothetical protein